MARPSTLVAQRRHTSSGPEVWLGKPPEPHSASSRTVDGAAGGAVGFVMGKVGGRAGAVVLAEGANARRLRGRSAIMIERGGIEGGEVLGHGPARQRALEIERRLVRDQLLRQRRRLRQEHPVVGLERQLGVHSLPHLGRRHDVQRGEAFDAGWMVEREAVGDAAAAIMAGEAELRVAERSHQLDHALRHRALVVGRVVFVRFWRGGCAIAWQVGHHQCEVIRELWRHAMPEDMRLRIAVQQQQRWAFAADPREQLARRGFDLARGESREQIGKFRHDGVSLCNEISYPGSGAVVTILRRRGRIRSLLLVRWPASRCRGGRSPQASQPCR